jgi:hypothetical protein
MFQPLLDGLDLAGTVVAADALQTHPEAAEFLVTSNRPTTCSRSRPTSPPCWRTAPACRGTVYPWPTAPATAHGRLEVRTLKAVTVGHFGFPTSPRSTGHPAGPATCTPRRGGGRP